MIARGGLQVPACAAHRRIGVKALLDVGTAKSLGVWNAVIDETPDGHQLRKLTHAANVIRMKMGDQQVVYLRDSGVTRGLDDAVRVARLMRITGLKALAVARPSR